MAEGVSGPLYWPDEALDSDPDRLVTTDEAREGERIGLAELKKPSRLFTVPGDGGIWDRVSIVRSDKDGRTTLARPLASTPCSSYAISDAGSPPPIVSLELFCT